jgi:hypothetical protein
MQLNRENLEHIIRAAAEITNEYEFVVIGSQSILGPIPDPPEIFKMSAEADIYPMLAIEKADDIDAMIGEGSQFHQVFGYYAQGVGPETACLPPLIRAMVTASSTSLRIKPLIYNDFQCKL